MKPVPSHTDRLQSSWQWKGARHRRQIFVKCRIKTRDLRNMWKSFRDGFDQCDRLRKVFRRKLRDPPKLVDHRIVDPRRIEIPRPAMNDAMPSRYELLRRQIFEESVNRAGMIDLPNRLMDGFAGLRLDAKIRV